MMSNKYFKVICLMAILAIVTNLFLLYSFIKLMCML